jgi:hypothetical protein
MFQLAYLQAQVWDGKLPDIYVQDHKYFEHHAEWIKTLYGEGIEPIDQVAIHVRRGDYVDNHFYVDLMATPYYEDAMALFPGESFLVFSDDIKWCMQQKIFKDCDFSGGDEIADLNAMAGCKGVIMANSSFSWWGAYLSKGKVVAPKQWFSDNIERVGLLPAWIKI